MSSTFKYLDANQANTSKDDAAQSFLNEKLSKNRYTIQQQESLDASGGSSVVNASDGVVPAGETYAKYGKMPSALTDKSADAATDTSTTSSAGSADKYRGFGQDSDSGRNYASGAWGSGELDAAGLAAKYNLDTSQEGRGDGHIWGRNADGSEVYIGKSSMDLTSNKDLIANHSKQASEDEIDHSGIPESLSSSGDIKGAILNEWKSGNGAAKEAEPEKERTPIEHSPEIKQAKERVKSYEGNILSGETSEAIYGSGSDYSFDAAKGAAGIGTPMNGDSGQQASKATASFLDKKLFDVKAKQQFQPTS